MDPEMFPIWDNIGSKSIDHICKKEQNPYNYIFVHNCMLKYLTYITSLNTCPLS